MPTSDLHDIVAVGAGPANLSLAALARPLNDVDAVVLESAPAFSWHPGMMLSGAAVQTAPLKDLVTLVAPTSPYSFLNFLAKHGRLYRYLIAARGPVMRREFEQYYTWAAEQLDVQFGAHVEMLEHDGTGFVLYAAEDVWRARNVVVGIGQVPYVPDCVKPWLSGDVFHSADYLSQPRELAGRDVLIVGGGQSAADIVMHLIAEDDRLPHRLTWTSGRGGFLPLDDSPFSNEWFNPRYVRHFYELGAERRRQLLEKQLLASDGMDESTLLSIYRRLYEIDYLSGGPFEHALLSGHRLVGLTGADARYEATIASFDTDEARTISVDAVILATGYQSQLASFLAPIESRLLRDERGSCRIDASYRLAFDGPPGHGLFVQGAAQATHGIADPNLSLGSWRSAVILNEICEREAYRLDRDDVTLSLLGPSRQALAANATRATHLEEGHPHGQ